MGGAVTSRRDFMGQMVGSAAMMGSLPGLAGGRIFGGRSGGEIYDVTEFGADPTGSADSTTGFQKALDAVPAKGGVVLVPPGRYRVCSTVVWPAVSDGSSVLKPALLVGRNPSAIKGVSGGWSEGVSAVAFAGEGPLFDLRLGRGEETRFSGGMANLALHGEGAEGTTGVAAYRVSSAQFRNVVVRRFGVNVHVAGDSFYSVWDRCLFSDAVTDGVQFRGEMNGSGFQRLRFAANGRHGISLQRSGVPVYFHGCWFEGNGAFGIRAVDATHLRVAGCYFEGNRASSIRFLTLEDSQRAGAVALSDCYFRPVSGGCCLELGGVPARARLLDCIVNGDHAPGSVVRSSRDTAHSLVAVGGSRHGETEVPLINGSPESFEEIVALGDEFARDDEALGSSHALRGQEALRVLGTPIEFPAMSAKERPAPGRPGRVIFNPTQGTLNIDTGARWVRPGGGDA